MFIFNGLQLRVISCVLGTLAGNSDSPPGEVDFCRRSGKNDPSPLLVVSCFSGLDK